MSYLYHITLDTGDIATTPRNAVADGVLAALAPHLARAIANASDIIPHTTYSLTASHAGPHLIGTILHMTGRPILTFGVAPRSRGSEKLWSLLVEGRDFASDPGDPPDTPWIAVRMEAGASKNTLEMWMADYERCIAWAWIEGQVKATRQL